MNKNKRRGIVGIALAALMVCALLVPAGAGFASSPVDPWPPVLKIEGSTTVFPIAVAAAPSFEARWPGTDVQVRSTGSGAGIRDLLDGEIHVGMSSRELTAAEKTELAGKGGHYYNIATDAIVPVVRDSTAMAFISNITIAQLKWIYERGTAITTTRWSDIPGAGAGWPANLVVPRARIIGSGTRVDFNAFCGIDPALEESTIKATGISRLHGNVDVVAAIEANDFHIGYIAAGYIEPGLKVLTVDGFDHTRPAYPMGRLLYMLTLCNARADDFINYMFTAAGQAHVTAEGFGPVPVVNLMIADFDVNKDKAVSTADIMPVYLNWGTTGKHNDVMHLGWIRADVNNDGAVSTADIMPVYLNWGKKAPW